MTVLLFSIVCPGCSEHLDGEAGYGVVKAETIDITVFCEQCKLEFSGELDRVAYNRDQLSLF